MANIDKYLKRFEGYQNGDLSSEEEKAFTHSLSQDKDMNAAWKEYLKMMEAFSDKEAISLRVKLESTYLLHHKNRQKKLSQSLWFRASAAAIIIVAMGSLLYFFCSGKSNLFIWNDNTLMVKTDTLETKQTDTLNPTSKDIIRQEDQIIDSKIQTAFSIYDNETYQINPVFEQLLHNTYRGDWFRMESPKDSIECFSGDHISFAWKTNITDSTYFDILDRNGRVVYKHDVPIVSPWKYIIKLDPAIYMFRISTRNEPIWLGVLVVVKK